MDFVERVLLERSLGILGAAPRVRRELSLEVTRLETRDIGLWRSGFRAGAHLSGG